MTKRNADPFYAWLDHERIRDLVHGAGDLTAGERLVLIKGLVPDLVAEIGANEFDRFLEEVRTKARRFDEAQASPGAGHGHRRTPGEALGGPIPQGHHHLGGHRDAHRPGGRDAERHRESEEWVRTRRAQSGGSD